MYTWSPLGVAPPPPLGNRECLTVFTTMCPKEQQTSDDLIVKDYCFIIEIFDKFSFGGTPRGCLSHEA